MTSEEREILNLILSGEMEIKNASPFLVQVFDTDTVASITELMQRQEYPLHAHLLPGHFVRAGLSQNALLQLVDAGEAGLPEQQNQLNAEQRLPTMFFRSAPIAKQWAGSFCPFDRRGMQLIDYRVLRHEFPDAVQRNDTYRVSILLLRGKISPTEMHVLLTKELQLRVAVLNRPTLSEHQPGRGRWEVIVIGPKSTDVLTLYFRIQLPHAELLIHHSDTEGTPTLIAKPQKPSAPKLRQNVH
ncbi:hypothetical protein PHMEG_00016098 [Phytophthora megakarya]|uniref:Uncharacterized protein n=1 Tax=Phytophthora megakarya TaxID=4795 RepID=A0A225W039_9STRA|nr:hypothetical protein PHMEG_00016098 [Phytophthora megakarya]